MNHPSIPGRDREAGFTLIEALVAMVILMFGVAAVANLMVVAGSSNTVANHATATTAAATRQMELLKSVPYTTLVNQPGGDVNNDLTLPVPICAANWAPNVWDCNTPIAAGTTEYQGVGQVHLRWSVTSMAPAAQNTFFIQVAAESTAPAIGRRSRAYFTSIRTQ
jgi:Tfp pilus assembly protein PilV